MTSILVTCVGVLLGVLWMDLTFDVQVLRHRATGGDLPDDVLTSIATYYARVTTAARTPSHLIAAVMLVSVTTVVVELATGRQPLWLRLLAALLVGGPIVLALTRVFPDAVRLGRRVDAISQQSALARSICRNHLVCFVSLVAFLVLRSFAGW